MTSGVSALSPESTVTSLLASSGRLRSSLQPEPARTIKYKNRSYDSATEALDAYIADFQWSQRTSGASVGHLELSRDPDTPTPFLARYRNRDVLRESLTDQELDVLRLPTGSPCRGSDHHSVTTDDLLLLPCDGSLPVTRTSAALSRPRAHQLGCSVNSFSRSCSRPGGDVKMLLHGGPAVPYTKCGTLGRDVLVGGVTSPRGRHLPSTPLATEAPPPGCQPSHYLPRWITSRKSEMDFSGVTSIPDLRYPIWLRECHIPTEAADSAPAVPSWVSGLERNTASGQQEPKGHEKGKGQRASEHATLQELSLGFAETLAVAESGGSVWEEPREPFQDDKIGFLIQRAEEMLKSPSLGLGISTMEDPASPGPTEELLEHERSWDNPPVTFKSPVPVGGAEEQLSTKEAQIDTTEKSVGSCSSGYSSRKHPGPVEALKQMLFSLQAVEQRVTHQVVTGSPKTLTDPLTEETPRAGRDCEAVQGGESLRRALHHLGRLKSLVDEMNERKVVELQQGGV